MDPQADDMTTLQEGSMPAMRSHLEEGSTVRKMGPLLDTHPAVGERCPACRACFAAGDFVALIPLGPGDNVEEQAKARAGRVYTAVAAVVHWDCAGGVE